MLIDNTEELRQYIPVSIALKYEDIAPQMRMVERDIIIDKFSQPVYDIARAAPAEGPDMKLYKLLAEAVAYLSVLEYLSIGQVHITSSGILINSTQNQKTAFEWQVRQVKSQMARVGWSAVESAMAHLSALPEGDLATAWQATEAYQLSVKSLIPSLKHFQKFVHLGNSHLLYQRLLPIQIHQQEEHIINLVGPALWAKVLNPPEDSSPESLAALRKLHASLSRALAYETMADGFLDTVLILSDNGPLIIDGLQSRLSDAKATAPEDFVKTVATTYRHKGAESVREVLNFCQENVALLPDYILSPNYIETDPDNHIARNDPEWGIAFF
jgi:hypothetical protein